MKTGKTLTELAQSLQAINDSKRDFIVPTEKLKASESEGKLNLGFTNGENHNFELNSYTSGQVANYTKIPTQYFRRLESENPSLLANNINHGMENNPNDHRMLRTINTTGTTKIRGFVSDKYRTLDSYDLLASIFPTFEKHGLNVISSEITDKRMYIHALSPKLKSDVGLNDPVQYGITISNSDVGAGSIRVEPMIYRLVCLNGMISNTAMRKYHVGRSKADTDIYELLTDTTKQLDDDVFWRKVKDLIEASLVQERFNMEVAKIRDAGKEEIQANDPLKVVEISMKATGITGQNKSDAIIKALASGNQGAGYTKWGLVNSFTAAANSDKFTYEDSIELQRAGGKILELNKKDWASISAIA